MHITAMIYHLHIFLPTMNILRAHSDQLPVGLIAELVEHCTGIAVSDHGLVSNTVQA